MEIYYRAVLDAESPKSRGQQGSAPSETHREFVPCLFLPSGSLSSAIGIVWIIAVPLLSLPPM